MEHTDTAVVFLWLRRWLHCTEPSQDLWLSPAHLEPQCLQARLDFRDRRISRWHETRLDLVLLDHTDTNAWNGALQFLAPLLHEKLLVNDDQEALLELTGQPDGHEGLAVAAGNTDQTILGTQTVIRSQECFYDRQLLWSQSLVKDQLCSERPAFTPCITVR